MKRPTTIEIVGGPQDGQHQVVETSHLHMRGVHMTSHGPCYHDWHLDLPPGSHSRINGLALHDGALALFDSCPGVRAW